MTGSKEQDELSGSFQNFVSHLRYFCGVRHCTFGLCFAPHMEEQMLVAAVGISRRQHSKTWIHIPVGGYAFPFV